jgi:hypothetical protein
MATQYPAIRGAFLLVSSNRLARPPTLSRAEPLNDRHNYVIVDKCAYFGLIFDRSVHNYDNLSQIHYYLAP